MLRDFVTATGRVIYKCSCGTQQPLAELYLCEGCAVLRCIDCVQEMPEAVICERCSQSVSILPCVEAGDRERPVLCPECYSCPVCDHTLTVRQPSTDDRVQYLACALCSWTTREAGLADVKEGQIWDLGQQIDSDVEQHLSRTAVYLEEMKSQFEDTRLSLFPRYGSRRATDIGGRPFSGDSLLGGYGVRSTFHRRRELLRAQMGKDRIVPAPVVEPVSIEDDACPEELWTVPVVSTDGAMLRSLLAQSAAIPSTVSTERGMEYLEPLARFPTRVRACTRTSLHCKACSNRNLLRFESSTRVKRSLFHVKTFARSSVPEIRLAAAVDWNAAPIGLFLTVTNAAYTKCDVEIWAAESGEKHAYGFFTTQPLCTLSLDGADDTADVIAEPAASFATVMQSSTVQGVCQRLRHRALIRLHISKPEDITTPLQLRLHWRNAGLPIDEALRDQWRDIFVNVYVC